MNCIENPLGAIIGQRARIESSLFEAGQKAGMLSRTIMTLANQIFGWDIDFALDIRKGDEFGVLRTENCRMAATYRTAACSPPSS